MTEPLTISFTVPDELKDPEVRLIYLLDQVMKLEESSEIRSRAAQWLENRYSRVTYEGPAITADMIRKTVEDLS